MTHNIRGLAVITGASSGIGLELARIARSEGHDLVIVAENTRIEDAAGELRGAPGAGRVEAVEADLSTLDGVDKLYAALSGRPVDLLFANAGTGLGNAFLDEQVEAWRRVIDTNVTGTLYLLHRVANDMRRRGAGRILITGSIAGHIPGTFQAVYNGTKAFIDSFGIALRHELDGSGVSVTVLKPGATDTDFFARAGMLDTKVGQAKKDDPAKVARDGFDALLRGDDSIVSGIKNKLQVAAAGVLPDSFLAEQHRTMAEPHGGTGGRNAPGRQGAAAKSGAARSGKSGVEPSQSGSSRADTPRKARSMAMTTNYSTPRRSAEWSGASNGDSGGGMGRLAGAAAVGVGVGLALALGRKVAVQAVTAASGDWMEGLKTEHKIAMGVIEALEATRDDAMMKRTGLMATLKHALSKHAFQEENVIYPALREATRNSDAEELAHDHLEIKQYLYDLDRMPKNDPNWLATLRQLKEVIAEHVREEEDEIFPAFRQRLSDEENKRLTAMMNKEGFKLA